MTVRLNDIYEVLVHDRKYTTVSKARLLLQQFLQDTVLDICTDIRQNQTQIHLE